MFSRYIIICFIKIVMESPFKPEFTEHPLSVLSLRTLAGTQISVTPQSCHHTHMCEPPTLLSQGQGCHQSIVIVVWSLALFSICCHNYFYCFVFQKLNFKMCMTSQIRTIHNPHANADIQNSLQRSFYQNTSLLPSSFAQNCR